MTLLEGPNFVDINRRIAGAAQYLEDRTDDTCVYYGVTPDMLTATSEPQWQIWRVSNVAGVLHTEYANRAKYDQIWDDRATIFPPCAGTDPIWPPVGDITGDFSGEVTVSGLTIAGRMTVVSLPDGVWTLLPAVALPDRNALAIQNQSGVQVKYNYDNTEPGYVGSIINPGSERFLNITESIPVYAKPAPGNSPSILVEEIS